MIPSTSINVPALPPNFGLATVSSPPVEGPSFQDMFLKSLQQTASIESKAQNQIAQGLAGGDVTIVESTIAMREADLALRMMLQVRNKLLDAYNEIKQMQF